MPEFDDIIGRADLKKSLEVAIEAAQFRKVPLGHLLISGGGGCGKTHILKSICKATRGHLKITQGNCLTVKRVEQFFTEGCQEAQVHRLFAFFIIDEIHEIPLKVQEQLYYPMDHGLVLTAGDPIQLQPFTLAGATTMPEELDGKSLINRFAHHWKLDEMDEMDLMQLVNAHMMKRKMNCLFEPLSALSQRCRGIPRLALRYADKAIDYANYHHRHQVLIEDVKECLNEFGIDEIGLDELQRNYLKVLYESEKPVGLEAISNTIGEEKDRVKKLVEPYLWRLKLITSSSQGRELTPEGHKHLMVTEGLAGRL